MQRTQLVKHIDQHDPKLMKTIAGVETVDHPSDAELVAHARHYLLASDRMQVAASKAIGDSLLSFCRRGAGGTKLN